MAVIGEVTDDGELRALFAGGELVGAIPARLLTDEAPRYELEQTSAAPDAAAARRRPGNDEPSDWVFEQYDQLVGSRTRAPAGPRRGGAACSTASAASPSRSTGPPPGERDPFAAGWSAVMSAALNVACAGGEPLALTDCLNFGNPERPEIAWELARAIDGIAQAARELGIPVVSGNVSLYNETGGRPIPPTPVVGCVGLVADVGGHPVALAAPGDARAAAAGRGGRARRLRLAERAPLHARPRRRPGGARRRRCARPAPGAGMRPASPAPPGPA